MALLVWAMMGLLVASAPGEIGPVKLSAAEPTITDDRGATERLFALVNQARHGAGLPLLAWDERLSQAARRHAVNMAERQELSHGLRGEPDFAERLADVELAIRSAGENVARAASADRAHLGWMESPGHRDNILNRDYDSLGIGVVRRGGTLYLTEDFVARVAPRRTVVPVPNPRPTDVEATEFIAGQFDTLLRRAGKNPVRRRDTPVEQLIGEMVRQDQLSGSAALLLPGAHYALAYTVSEVSELGQFPAEAPRLDSLPRASQYAVAVRFSRTTKHPRGAYWVVLVLFSSGDGGEVLPASQLSVPPAAIAHGVSLTAWVAHPSSIPRVDQRSWF